jgi:hypothetical protein
MGIERRRLKDFANVRRVSSGAPQLHFLMGRWRARSYVLPLYSQQEVDRKQHSGSYETEVVSIAMLGNVTVAFVDGTQPLGGRRYCCGTPPGCPPVLSD